MNPIPITPAMTIAATITPTPFKIFGFEGNNKVEILKISG